MRLSLALFFAAALAAQNTAEAEAAPAPPVFQYAQLWFGDTYTVGVGINARLYTRAVICYFQESGCRFGVVEIERQLADTNSQLFARYLSQEAVAKAAALLGRQGWKLVSTTADERLGTTLLFRRKEPPPN